MYLSEIKSTLHKPQWFNATIDALRPHPKY